MATEYRIYGLREPNQEMFRYIGYTSMPFNRRLTSHLSDYTKSHRTYWLQSLKQEGLKPEMILIEGGISDNEVCQKEIQYIKLFRSFGAKLVNGTNGGDGMRNLTEETRAKMSASHIGKPNKSKGIKRAKQSKELIEKRRISMTGVKRNFSKDFYHNMGNGKRVVLQYDLHGNFIKEWESTMDAMRGLNLKSNAISMVCLGKQNTTAGFKWKYK